MTLRIGKRAALALTVAVGLVTALPAHALQCVPYAREASGIDLRGDAWRWWNAAAGVYERGHAPRLGAVMVFQKYGKMRLGHVAVVQHIVSSREVLIDHANWGPRGARGRVSKMVSVRDVSSRNDWTKVQVWNLSSEDFGTRTYPTYGFIYPHGGAKTSAALFSVDMPEDVTSLLAAAESSAAKAEAADPMIEAISYSFVTAAPEQPVTARAIQASKADYAEEAPAQPTAIPAAAPSAGRTKGVWDGDRQAALKAGSGKY